MTTKPIPDVGQKWKSNAGVIGEVVGFFDDSTPQNKIASVKNEFEQLAYENYFVLLQVPNATGPIVVQGHTFRAVWNIVVDTVEHDPFTYTLNRVVLRIESNGVCEESFHVQLDRPLDSHYRMGELVIVKTPGREDVEINQVVGLRSPPSDHVSLQVIGLSGSELAEVLEEQREAFTIRRLGGSGQIEPKPEFQPGRDRPPRFTEEE